MVHLDHKVKKAQEGGMEAEARMVREGKQDLLDLQAMEESLAHRDTLECQDCLENKDLLESQARGDIQVLLGL